MSNKACREIIDSELLKIDSSFKIYKIKKKLGGCRKDYYRFWLLFKDKNKKHYNLYVESPDNWQLDCYVEMCFEKKFIGKKNATKKNNR